MSVITIANFQNGYLGIKRRLFETTFIGPMRIIPIQISDKQVRLALKAPRSVAIARDDAIRKPNPVLFDDDAMVHAFAAVDEGIGLARELEPEDIVGNLDAVAKLCRALLVLSGEFEVGGPVR